MPGGVGGVASRGPPIPILGGKRADKVTSGRTGVRAKAAIPFAEREIDFASLSPSNVMVNDSGGGGGSRGAIGRRRYDGPS